MAIQVNTDVLVAISDSTCVEQLQESKPEDSVD
jgi:hypothetical protein